MGVEVDGDGGRANWPFPAGWGTPDPGEIRASGALTDEVAAQEFLEKWARARIVEGLDARSRGLPAAGFARLSPPVAARRLLDIRQRSAQVWALRAELDARQHAPTMSGRHARAELADREFGP